MPSNLFTQGISASFPMTMMFRRPYSTAPAPSTSSSSSSIPRSISGKPSSTLPPPLKRVAAASAALGSSSPTTPSPASPRDVPASSKSLFASYRSLSPNTRIVFGLCIAAVGLAGLYWDRSVKPIPPGEDKPIVAVRMVDREKKRYSTLGEWTPPRVTNAAFATIASAISIS